MFLYATYEKGISSINFVVTMYLVQFLRYPALKNGVTLKTG